MASKAFREGDSPSSSSVFLPQLRQSRRGSIASLASVSQPEKEAISQVLDQIHNSASQSETLTTFNEYTSPPPSSSGPDSKGIAGELQGGISGLYNRFRASVGNVREAINPGQDDRPTDSASTESPKPHTPSSTRSSKTPEESGSIFEGANPQDGRIRQPPYARNRAADAKSSLERGAILKPPPTPIKQPSNIAGASPSLRKGNEFAFGTADKVQTSRKVGDIDQFTHHPNDVKKDEDQETTLPHTVGNSESNDSVRGNLVQPFPLSAVDAKVPEIQSQSTEDSSLKPRDTANKDLADDVSAAWLASPNGPSKNDMERKYQHLEIPSRKSLAPPVVSRSTSPRPSLTRGSSTESNVDSLTSIPNHQSPPKTVGPSSNSRGGSIAGHLQAYSKPATSRDSRTMNVFSQVKNKVLNKEYWMKDENARDCFCCGDAFSTFRRKHHCSE